MLFFVNVVCGCLLLQTSQIVFPARALQTEECSEEDKRLKTKVFFLGGCVWGGCLHLSVIIKRSAFFSLHPSLMLSLHQGQNAYTTMEKQGERRGENLWGEKLQGEFEKR